MAGNLVQTFRVPRGYLLRIAEISLLIIRHHHKVDICVNFGDPLTFHLMHHQIKPLCCPLLCLNECTYHQSQPYIVFSSNWQMFGVLN